MTARALLGGKLWRMRLATLAVVFLASRCAAAGDAVARQPGEAPAAFAARLLPAGMELAAPATEVRCGPPGVSIVVLFRPTDSGGNYRGWVLSPIEDGGHRYRTLPLPPMDEIDGLFEIEVKNIFAAPMGGSTTPVLVVLYHYYRLGTGDQEGTAAYVYRWDGTAFQIDADAGQRIHKLKSEREIRAKLGGTSK